MRRLLGAGLAVLAWQGEAIGDPSVPQVSPLHRQREDAQRLIEQQRGLARERPPEPAPLAQPMKAPPPVSGDGKGATAIGVVLIGISGVTALTALPLLAFEATKSEDTPSAGTLTAVVTITAVVTGVTGFALVLGNRGRTVQVSPAVTASAVGVTISGRL